MQPGMSRHWSVEATRPTVESLMHCTALTTIRSAIIYRMLISGGSDSGGSDDFLEPPTIPRVDVARETTGGNVARFTSRERLEAKRRPATKWVRRC